MNLRDPRSGFPRQALYGVIAIVCVASLPWSSPLVLAQEAPQDQSQETTTAEEAPKIPNEQLDSLVAPIALYPDAMLTQTLAASTYPLEVMQLDQWMDKNKNRRFVGNRTLRYPLIMQLGILNPVEQRHVAPVDNHVHVSA